MELTRHHKNHNLVGCIRFAQLPNYRDNGFYTVIAENQFGKVNRSIMITLITAPGKLANKPLQHQKIKE